MLQILVTTLGVIQLARGKASNSLKGNILAGSSHSPSQYSLALYSGLWAFDGWDQANYVGGEVHHPEKNIPRVIHGSMAIVTVSPRPVVSGRIYSPTLAPVSHGKPFVFRCA